MVYMISGQYPQQEELYLGNIGRCVVVTLYDPENKRGALIKGIDDDGDISALMQLLETLGWIKDGLEKTVWAKTNRMPTDQTNLAQILSALDLSFPFPTDGFTSVALEMDLKDGKITRRVD